VNAFSDRLAPLQRLSRACGTLPVASVVAGGRALGFAVWHIECSRVRGLPSVGAFAVLAAAGVLLAGFAWLWPCTRAAANGAGTLVAILRWNAVAYVALLAYPFALVFWGGKGGAAGALVAATGYAFCSAVTAARFFPGFRTTLVVFAISRITVFAIAELGATFVGVRQTVPGHNAGLLDVWTRWDGVHYLAIAREGYRGSNLAFFPLYPVAIRLVQGAVGNPILAAVAISNLSLLIGLEYVRRLIAERFDDAVAARTLMYLVSFPTAIFFSAAYSESLFFALSAATFFYLRRSNWLLAGCLGGLTALTRGEGVLLLVPYAIEADAHRRLLGRAGGSLDILRGAPAIGAAMIVFGLLTFMVLSALLSGDPLHFVHVQAHWNRHPAWPWASISRNWHEVVTSRDQATVIVQAIELAFAALAIALFVAGIRLLPRSMSAYTALSLLMPLFSGSLMSTQRFVLVLFPLFAVLGVYGRSNVVNLTIVAIFLPLFGAFTLLYAAGYWIG